MNHFKNIEKTKPEILLSMFCSEFVSCNDFYFINGVQPFLINYKGRKFHIYIKNISSAYFSDRDSTTRAQLPIKEEFNEIKKSNFPFIFLGYDSLNDVYVCWNFHEVKKRLNVGKSVSFYSRSFFQSEVGEAGFLRKKLKNGDHPVLFKRKNLIDFFDRIDTFFENNYCTNIRLNEQGFVDYLINDKKLSPKSAQNYTSAINGKIQLIINKNLINTIDSLYKIESVESLILLKRNLNQISEFIELNNRGKNMYSCAFDNLVSYAKKIELQKFTVIGIDKSLSSVSSDNNDIIEGKINSIVDAYLLSEIKPHILSNRMLTAAQIVGKYYQNKYPKMKLSDWLTILKNIKFPPEK